MRFRPWLFVLVWSGLALTSACSSSSGSPSLAQQVLPLTAGHPTSGSAGLYIKHVVVIIQENRSFENFFAGYPGANAPMYGYGKDGRATRQDSASSASRWRAPHELAAFVGRRDSDDGQRQMDGFRKYGRSERAGYSYVQRGEIAPYWQMAKQYVLADAMFPTEIRAKLHGAPHARCRYRQHRSDEGRGRLSELVSRRLRFQGRYDELVC